MGFSCGRVICPEETGSSDLSDNEFSGSIELQGNTKYILSYSVKNGGELPFSHLYNFFCI